MCIPSMHNEAPDKEKITQAGGSDSSKAATGAQNNPKLGKIFFILFFILLFILIVLFLFNERDKSESFKIADVDQYGNSLSMETDWAIMFSSTERTTKTPNAFKLHFQANHSALTSRPVKELGDIAYLTKTGRTIVWKSMFCTNELRDIMVRHKIDLAVGNLTDLDGETQSMALCLSS